MPKITFLLKDGTTHEVNGYTYSSLMQTAVVNKLEGIEGACNGCMSCATCHCYIHPDWVERVNAQDNEQSETEKDMLDTCFDVRETSRLGCQVKLNDALDGLIVAMPGTDTGW